MKKDQPALLQKYMKLRHQSVELLSMADQFKGAGLSPAGRCPSIHASSASLTARFCRGVSRYHIEKPQTQSSPKTPKRMNAPRQPGNPSHKNGSANATISTGATAPPQRPNVQISPCARPLSVNGNQLRAPRAILG